MRLLDSPGHFRLEKLTSSKKGGSPEVHPLAFGKLLLEPNPTLSPSVQSFLGEYYHYMAFYLAVLP